MIFPVLRGFLPPHLIPVTFLLFSLNFLVFIFTLEANYEGDQKIESILSDRSFVETQGVAFAVMISREPQASEFSTTLHRLAAKALGGDSSARRILGNLALRNATFMRDAETYDFGGDEVALKKWRADFTELKSIQANHPTYLWGLSRLKSDWIQYISYQFSHSGFVHLFWNMVFLLIFGGFVETRLGGSFVILSYLGGGLLGAFAFSKLSGISSSPLVGASAAVSALIALVGITWLKRGKLRFFYWLLPAQGYYGFVWLPSWLVLLVMLVPDLSGYLAAARDVGSVAYSAHLGGAAWGALMALALSCGLLRSEYEGKKEKRSENESPNDHDRFSKAS